MAPECRKMLFICAFAGAAVVVGGIVLYKSRRSKDDEEDLTFAKSKSLDTKLVETGPKGELKQFLEYGVSLQLPPDWEAMVDDFSMVGPQIAVIRIHPPGYEQAIPGEMPSLSVIVEDVGREQMTLLAYKDKSKEYAMTMGGGGGMAMMTPPEITKDGSVSVGPFQHTLEYTQMFPNIQAGGHIPYKFMNLMTLHKGLAYVLQYMVRSDRFAEHLDAATGIAESLAISDLPPRPASCLEFCSQPHSLKVTVPETWAWTRENKDMGDGRTLVVSFMSGAASKPDSISLYTLNATCSSPKAMAERYRETMKVTAEVTLLGDIANFSYNADGKIVVVYCRREYVLECRPEGDRVTHHSQEDAVVCGVLRSVAYCKGLDRSSCRYRNAHSRFSFEVMPGSKLLEHKWGTTCVTYVPVSDEQEQSVPIFTVEVNQEEEYYPDLQAVEAKIMAGNDPATPLKDKKIETHRGRDYLTFVITRDEQVSPWGQSEEFRSKILLTLRGKESVMLKWEVAGSEWKRYEKQLAALLESLDVLAS